MQLSATNYDLFNQCIESFCKNIIKVSERQLSKLTKKEELVARDLYERWKTFEDKLVVSDCYRDNGWRAVYARQLFEARIMTVLYSFNELLKKFGFQLHNYLSHVLSFVSIGCGPGSDIAATLVFLRIFVGSEHYVRVLGVDKYGEWNEYVSSLNKVSINGNQHKIKFQKLLVNEDSVDELPDAGICIMSYTDAAVHSGEFWMKLKYKFQLIVILDQKNSDLKRVLSSHGYNMVEYEFKETKRFFYWFSPIQPWLYSENNFSTSSVYTSLPSQDSEANFDVYNGHFPNSRTPTLSATDNRVLFAAPSVSRSGYDTSSNSVISRLSVTIRSDSVTRSVSVRENTPL